MPRVIRATYFLALSLCAVLAAACGDPFVIRAPFSTASDSFAVLSVTGTPASARALWRIGSFARFRLDSIGGSFDLAFGIDAAGRAIIYPARTIITAPASAFGTQPQVGLLVSTEAFAAIDRAPLDGYRVDTALTVSKGQAVFVRTASDVCSLQQTGGTLLYAKIVVDSIDAATRQLFVRATIQPSCNFRSFATGVPTF